MFTPCDISYQRFPPFVYQSADIKTSTLTLKINVVLKAIRFFTATAAILINCTDRSSFSMMSMESSFEYLQLGEISAIAGVSSKGSKSGSSAPSHFMSTKAKRSRKAVASPSSEPSLIPSSDPSSGPSADPSSVPSSSPRSAF
jgi:hypothetical protein